MDKKDKIDLKGAIHARLGNKKYPVIKVVESDPELASVLSKLHKSREIPGYNTDGNREPPNPDVSKLKEVASKTANNINDSQIAMQMLPDLELASQILISIILSPKDMMTVEPNFMCGDDITSAELSGKLIQSVKKYFEDQYDLKGFLNKSLRDILFETGSYPMLVIPENSVDQAINGYTKFALESFNELFTSTGNLKNIGLLGNPGEKLEEVNTKPKISSEAFNYNHTPTKEYDPKIKFKINGSSFDTNVSVVDNFNIVKLPSILKRSTELKEDKIIKSNSILNFSLEDEISKLQLNDRELTGLLYKERNSDYKLIHSLRTDYELDRMMLGNPLILHLPSESVIPVYIPGSPEKQIGYFVLLDPDGNPLDLSGEKDSYKELSSRMDSNGSFPSAMLNKVQNSMFGSFNCGNRDHLDYASRVYGEMIEADLLSRLRNGKYVNGAAIANKEEIYRIMFARSLANKSTQMLWVPSSLMTYFALKFNGNGIGKSLLDDLKIINSLRSMVTMANVMAMLKNAIARTGVRIKFDEEDPNPQQTFERVVHEILRSRQQIIPWGTINPADIADWAGKAGLEFIYEGHPGMPDVGIEFEDKQSNVTQPSTELLEELRKQTAMGLSLSPETLDATLQPDFATSIVQNNIMMSKRAMQIQDQYCPLVTDHVVKVIQNTPNILNDLLNLLYENFDEITLTPKLKQKVLGNDKLKLLVCKTVLKDFLNTLEFKLPRPDSVSLENQFTAIETKEKIIDKVLDYYAGTEMFKKEVVGSLGEHADTAKAILKSYFMRTWMAENGILPEISEITTAFETGEGTNEAYESQAKVIKSLTKNFTKFFISLRESKAKSDIVLKILKIAEGGGGGFDSGGSGGSDYSTDLSGDDSAYIEGFGDDSPTSTDNSESSETSESTETSETTTSDGTTTTTETTQSSEIVM